MAIIGGKQIYGKKDELLHEVFVVLHTLSEIYEEILLATH